jgi:hypothetical protein
MVVTTVNFAQQQDETTAGWRRCTARSQWLTSRLLPPPLPFPNCHCHVARHGSHDERSPIPCDRSMNHLHRCAESAYCSRSLVRRVVVDQRTPFPHVASSSLTLSLHSGTRESLMRQTSPWIIVQRCCQRLALATSNTSTPIADCTSWPAAARGHSDPHDHYSNTGCSLLDYGQCFGVPFTRTVTQPLRSIASGEWRWRK